MINPPCHNCADRALNCHSTCGSYAAWREANAEERRRQSKDRSIHKMAAETVIRRANRIRKKIGGGY